MRLVTGIQSMGSPTTPTMVMATDTVTRQPTVQSTFGAAGVGVVTTTILATGTAAVVTGMAVMVAGMAVTAVVAAKAAATGKVVAAGAAADMEAAGKAIKRWF